MFNCDAIELFMAKAYFLKFMFCLLKSITVFVISMVFYVIFAEILIIT